MAQRTQSMCVFMYGVETCFKAISIFKKNQNFHGLSGYYDIDSANIEHTVPYV